MLSSLLLAVSPCLFEMIPWSQRINFFRTLLTKHIKYGLCENSARKFRFYSCKSNFAPFLRSRTRVFLLARNASIGLGCWFIPDSKTLFFPSVGAAKPPSKKETSALKEDLRTRYNFIADVVTVVVPSVVYIEIKDHRRIDFFTGEPATVSNGSGFIVKENGLILTNAHVVINKPQSTVLVKLHDGKTYPGVVEDVDMKSDLATVRINCSGLQVMKLGTSQELRPGEWVVAIGSPLSLSNTITTGVVSSVNRPSEELGLRGKDMDYIQTDASITFGNSGGPLVNLNGEAIGINSMKVTPGISFAIPIDYAKEFLARNEKKKFVADKVSADKPIRRYMGITMLSLTHEIITELQLRDALIPADISHGVIVWKVVTGSPAFKGGLRPGDIITHVNGTIVESAGTIYSFLEKSGKMNVSVIRSGQRFNIVVIPEET